MKKFSKCNLTVKLTSVNFKNDSKRNKYKKEE